MPSVVNGSIQRLRMHEIDVHTYEDRPVINVAGVTIYPGDFGRASSKDLRDEAKAFEKLAEALHDASSWCLEESDRVFDREMAAEREAEAARRRVADFGDLIPNAAIDFLPNLEGQAS